MESVKDGGLPQEGRKLAGDSDRDRVNVRGDAARARPKPRSALGLIGMYLLARIDYSRPLSRVSVLVETSVQDDFGNIINPMIVEGQVHGGLADGVGMALMQVIAFDPFVAAGRAAQLARQRRGHLCRRRQSRQRASPSPGSGR